MIQIILGDKGSGKTKRLIDLVNESLKNEHGDIIFIDDDKRYMYDLRHEIRFVDASSYPAARKCSADAFLAFISGMLAADFDITMIVVDAFKKLVNAEMSELESLFEHLSKLSEQRHVNIVLSVSADAEELPEFVTKLAI